MNLDNPWKIVALVAALVLARLLWTVWKEAPSRKSVLEFMDAGLIAFTLVFLIVRPFVVQAFYIPSGSMTPTLLIGDRILVNRFFYLLNPPQRGDIIVFNAPKYALQGKAQADFVKRLVGLPGDQILIKNGDGVYVNGEKLKDTPETAIPDYRDPRDDRKLDWPTDGKPYVVPKGNYFVLGDNRNNSYDSHLWEEPRGEFHPELPADQVLGKAVVTFWPLRQVGLLNDHAKAYLPSEREASH